MSTTPILSHLDLSKVHFMPMTQKEGTKSVQVFLNSSSTAANNRIKFQLCPNEESPVKTTFPLDQVRSDSGGDGLRRGLVVTLTDPAVIKSLQAFDESIVNAALANSKEWFKKEFTREQIEARYKPILTPGKEEGEHIMKFKVKMPGSQVPTKCFKLNKANMTVTATNPETAFCNKGSEVIPILSAYALYFLAGDAQFGVSFQAEKIVVDPAEARDDMDDFTFSRTIKTSRPDSAEGAADAGAADGGDEEPSSKRIRVELLGEGGDGDAPAM